MTTDPFPRLKAAFLDAMKDVHGYSTFRLEVISFSSNNAVDPPVLKVTVAFPYKGRNWRCTCRFSSREEAMCPDPKSLARCAIKGIQHQFAKATGT